MISPTETLTAGSSLSFYAPRFHNDGARLVQDNEADDAVLAESLKSNRLTQWWASAKKVVKEAVEQDIEKQVSQETDEANAVEIIGREGSALPELLVAGAAATGVGHGFDEDGQEVLQSIEDDADVEMTDD